MWPTIYNRRCRHNCLQHNGLLARRFPSTHTHTHTGDFLFFTGHKFSCPAHCGPSNWAKLLRTPGQTPDEDVPPARVQSILRIRPQGTAVTSHLSSLYQARLTKLQLAICHSADTAYTQCACQGISTWLLHFVNRTWPATFCLAVCCGH